MNRIQCAEGSHMIQDLSVGRVLASRINYVLAKKDSKRYLNYLHLLNRQIRGFGDIDPNDMYRERELVDDALNAYRKRHNSGLVSTGWLYVHPEYQMLACTPDAVEAGITGFTVHIRNNVETYEKAIENSQSLANERVAQASMAVTGFPYWIHLDYWEDRQTWQRRLYETLFKKNPMSDEMLWSMAMFHCDATRAHAAAAA